MLRRCVRVKRGREPEFIVPQDGSDKQDCESRAARRWLAASLVMGAFTHASTDRPGRFSDDSYGVWYCGERFEVALRRSAQAGPATREMRPGAAAVHEVAVHPVAIPAIAERPCLDDRQLDAIRPEQSQCHPGPESCSSWAVRGQMGHTRVLLPLPARRTWKGDSSRTSRTRPDPLA